MDGRIVRQTETGKQVYPVIKSFIYVGSQRDFERLIQVFRLSVGLWVVGRAHSQLDLKEAA